MNGWSTWSAPASTAASGSTERGANLTAPIWTQDWGREIISSKGEPKPSDNFGGNTFLPIDNTDLTVMRMRHIAEDMVLQRAINLSGLIKLTPSHAIGLFTMTHGYVVVAIHDEKHVAFNYSFQNEAVDGYWRFKERYIDGPSTADAEKEDAAA